MIRFKSHLKCGFTFVELLINPTLTLTGQWWGVPGSYHGLASQTACMYMGAWFCDLLESIHENLFGDDKHTEVINRVRCGQPWSGILIHHNAGV